MAEILGTGAVLRSLRARSLKGKVKATAGVVFEAPYAVYVHEDLEAYHPHGEAKFLEKTARRKRAAIQAAIQAKLMRKRSVQEAAVAGAEVLLAETLPLVPIDTGYLYDSGKVVTE